MKGLIEEVCAEQQITILELEMTPNYVYLYADMPPVCPVNDMVRKIKRRTSTVLTQEFPELRSRLPSLWTLHYFLSTEPEKPVERIQDWMETQPRFLRKKKSEEANK